MKKKSVHFNKATAPKVIEPACGSANSNSQFTTDKREVTCENCKNSLAWKGRK
ncbi:MAG: hypothetical protein H0W76_27025 [Pyrinomonadaceae bacterium]|nr:hypothetical protein [Pyrinomonadaceae bacterium]